MNETGRRAGPTLARESHARGLSSRTSYGGRSAALPRGDRARRRARDEPFDGIAVSDREVTLLRLLATNTPRAEIAARLECSQSTIERRLVALRSRFGVDTTIEVVVAAVRAGLV